MPLSGGACRPMVAQLFDKRRDDRKP